MDSRCQTIFIDTGCYGIGGLFHVIVRVAHRHAESGSLPHRDIVQPVADSHDTAHRHSEMLRQRGDRLALGKTGGDNVDEPQITVSRGKSFGKLYPAGEITDKPVSLLMFFRCADDQIATDDFFGLKA